nr:MAG TPA: hypothetical protein [Caudoviricetes sp.]
MMEDCKLEVGKVYRGDDIVIVSKNFLENTVTENQILKNLVNIIMLDDDIPQDLKDRYIDTVGSMYFQGMEKPYLWVGLL